jgi:membrane-associated protein
MLLMELFFHLDDHLLALVTQYGVWVYVVLFLMIFCETGLIVMPFLPGDSLLFVAGTVTASAAGQAAGLDVHLMAGLLLIAAIIGDSLNYTIGRTMGNKLFSNPHSKIFRRDYLDQTHAFYKKHGGKTIIIARFVPVVRTFAPFVAGIGEMHYPRFILFNVVGGISWIVSFVYAGYFFGNLEFVKKNLTLLIFAIILLSISPAIVAYVRQKWGKRKG